MSAADITVNTYGPVSEPLAPAEALATLEAGLTDENDCSFFEVTFMGGPTPATVRVSPDEMRSFLRTLGA